MLTSTTSEPTGALTAEERFRASFYRLKLGVPQVLPKGTKVSQNNIAKEAGCDPSALRKSRFPILIMEIQEWMAANRTDGTGSERKKTLKQRRRNRDMREIIVDLKQQRDIAASLLVDANLRIVELSSQVKDIKMELEKLQPKTPIVEMHGILTHQMH